MNVNPKLIFYLFLLTFFTVTCSQKDKPALITTNIDMDGVEEIVLFSNLNGFRDTLLPVSENIELHIDRPQVLNVRYGKKSGSIYVQPGAVMELKADDDGLIIVGMLADENSLIRDINTDIQQINKDFHMNVIAKADKVGFLKKLQEKYASPDSIIKSYNDIDAALKSQVTKRIQSLKIRDKIIYPDYYVYLTKDTTPMEDAYYNFTSEIDLNDPDYLVFRDGADIYSSVIDRHVEYKGSSSDYYKELYQLTDSLIQNPEVKEFQLKKNLTSKINFGGLDGIGDMLDNYLANTKNEYYKKEVSDLAAKWEKLKKGLDAPGFDGKNRDGEVISLADLKGKNVYIDVWATWCGPCIREIPSLKELEQDYHDENIAFVSVSIDDMKDKEKWMNFVEEKELGGIQLMEENDWKSEIATNYNVRGIPRFILIDKEGKIVSADAPRPSSDKLRGMLDELL